MRYWTGLLLELRYLLFKTASTKIFQVIKKLIFLFYLILLYFYIILYKDHLWTITVWSNSHCQKLSSLKPRPISIHIHIGHLSKLKKLLYLFHISKLLFGKNILRDARVCHNLNSKYDAISPAGTVVRKIVNIIARGDQRSAAIISDRDIKRRSSRASRA